jgi:hypothetical protein
MRLSLKVVAFLAAVVVVDNLWLDGRNTALLLHYLNTRATNSDTKLVRLRENLLGARFALRPFLISVPIFVLCLLPFVFGFCRYFRFLNIISFLL